MTIFGIIVISLLISLLVYLLVIFKFGHVKCESNICLNGKVAVVTGGSSGIGYELVLQLASRGCKVIIADKLVDQQVKTSIVNETDNSNILLEFVDFASFKSVRTFAEKLKRTETKVDILINNVGIGKAPEQASEDGLNMTLQINHYSPFLFTHLLADLLKKSGAGRIVFTTSSASFLHIMTSDYVTNDEIKLSNYRMNDYSCAKLCTVVVSDIFARKLKRYNITCNTYHPGIVKSTFFQNTLENLNYFSFTDWWAYAHILFLRVFVGVLLLGIYTVHPPKEFRSNEHGGRSCITWNPSSLSKWRYSLVSPRKASQAALNLAIAKEYSKVTGTFFGKYFPNLKPKLTNDRNFCEKIWNVSEKIVKLRPEEKL